MHKAKEKQYTWVVDLSKPYCHVCKQPMVRDLTPSIQSEHCVNPMCRIRGVNFHIPHKEVVVNG